jgi:hypothetical protein
MVGMAVAKQELESMKLLRPVDDRLPPEEDIVGYVLHDCYWHVIGLP